MFLLRRKSRFTSVALSSWAVCCLALCLAPHRVQGQLSDGLIAYYAFDDGAGEILTEATGNGTDGELFNFDFDDQSN